jgi:type II secretory pathway component PulC
MLALLLAAALGPAPADLAATGIVVHPKAERCTAVLESSGRVRVASLGETAFGGRVIAIKPGSVELAFVGGPVTLRLAAGGSGTRFPAGGPVAAPPDEPAEDPATPHRMMSRTEVERRLGSEIPRILAETALAPALEDGRVVGLTVTRLADGTLLSDAGLRQGDVITEINGTTIDGMGTLIGLWPRLQGATDLEAIVKRAGRSVSLSVTLR